MCGSYYRQSLDTRCSNLPSVCSSTVLFFSILFYSLSFFSLFSFLFCSSLFSVLFSLLSCLLSSPFNHLPAFLLPHSPLFSLFNIPASHSYLSPALLILIPFTLRRHVMLWSSVKHQIVLI